MAVDFGLGRKLAGYGRDAAATARNFAHEVTANASRPGPEIKVDHFTANDVTGAAGFLRVGQALLSGMRSRANYEQAQRKSALDTALTESTINRNNAAAWADTHPAAKAVPFDQQRPGETDEQFNMRISQHEGAVAQARRKGEDPEMDVAYGGQTYKMRQSEAARFALDVASEGRRKNEADRGLTQQQQVLAAESRIRDIDEQTKPGSAVDRGIAAAVGDEGASLRDRIFQPGAKRFSNATADSAAAVLGMKPMRGDTPGNRTAVDNALAAWISRERTQRWGHAADSLATERRYAESVVTGAMGGLDPTQAAFIQGLKSLVPSGR